MRSRPYRRRTEAALDTYERLTGRRVPASRLDPDDDDVRASYRAFVRKRVGQLPGASHADRLALGAGLKPMVRELAPRRAWPAIRAAAERDGLLWRTHDLPVRQSVAGGLLTDRTLREKKGDDEAEDRASDRLLVLLGRDEEALEEALAIERAQVGGLDPERAVAGSARLGRLLGYPECCVDAFTELGQVHHNREPIAAAAARSGRFDPRLNNTLLSVFHHVSWFVCRYDCPESTARAAQIDRLLSRDRAEANRVLGLPRLYVDDRRQVILDAELRGDRMVVRDAFTPYALDRRAEHAALEWVFWIDVVAPIRRGDELAVEASELVVYEAGRVIDRVERPEGGVWLPFGAAA